MDVFQQDTKEYLNLRKIRAPIKIKSALPPPQKTPQKKGNFTDIVFPAERTHFFQVSIKLAQPFPAPELRTRILRTRGFFWKSEGYLNRSFPGVKKGGIKGEVKRGGVVGEWTGPEGQSLFSGGKTREKGCEERGPKAHSKNSDFGTLLIWVLFSVPPSLGYFLFFLLGGGEGGVWGDRGGGGFVIFIEIPGGGGRCPKQGGEGRGGREGVCGEFGGKGATYLLGGRNVHQVVHKIFLEK